MQLSLFFVYGNLIFRIDAFRDPVTLFVLCVTWTVACTSLGMLIAVSVRTVRQAETLTYILVLILAGLGGCWIPKQIMNLPASVELLTRFMVTNWAMAGFQGMFWDQLPWTHHRMLTAIGIQWAFALPVSAPWRSCFIKERIRTVRDSGGRPSFASDRTRASRLPPPRSGATPVAVAFKPRNSIAKRFSPSRSDD